MDEGNQLRITLQAISKQARSGPTVRTREFNLANRLLAALTMLLSAALTLPVLAQSPEADFDTVTTRAAAARDGRDMPTAIQLYTEAVGMRPNWAEGWWSLGTLEYSTDQFTPAREALSHFIDLTPTAGPALALRGLCEFELGQYPESLEDLQHGIALGAASQPRNAPIVLYHEALLLTRLGRFDEAIAKYAFFVKHATVNPALAMAIGLAGLRMPLLPKDVTPAQAELVAAVGNAAIPVMNGDLPGGQQAFQEVFSRYPTTPNIHYFYGYLLFSAHSDQAIPQFEQEIGVSPQSAIAHAMLAWSVGFSGDYAAALPAARDAVAEDPSLLLGQMMYGRALVETGDVTAGLPYIQKVLQQDPSNLEAHLTLAKAYSKLGRSEDARQERQLCLKMADQGAPPSATP
jgi:tetratricopeptide (TPR) repeat protein